MVKYSSSTKSQCSEEWFSLTLHEVVYSFGVQEELIIEIIEEGIVSPAKNKQGELQFDSEALSSIHTAIRLNRDLGINMPGAALVLELMHEIDRLRQKT